MNDNHSIFTEDSFKKINFGCGYSPLEGWTNVDGGDGLNYEAPAIPNVINANIFEYLSCCPEDTTEFITSEHFIEHFDREEGHILCSEWFRILKKGGVVRISTPDLQHICRVYLNLEKDFDWEGGLLPHAYRAGKNYGNLRRGERYLRSMFINAGFTLSGHKFLYDFETLSQTLSLAGFSIIYRVKFGKSTYPELHAIDLHDGGETGRRLGVSRFVLIVEAVKV